MTLTIDPQPTTHHWQWQGLSIRYQAAGAQGPAVVLIHGFGASSDHWRKNIPTLAANYRVYAIDLLGFGLSAKPAPGDPVPYTFETWADQINAFSQEVIGEPVFLIANSIGCIAALQAAAIAPEQVLGVAMLNCSLRLLHERKRDSIPWYRRATVPLFQRLLTYRPFGHYFFNRLAKPNVIRKVLLQAYINPEAVTDDLVEALYRPALDLGAADVFIAFSNYSYGPLAEDLLPQMTCPVLIIWGASDPWEPVDLGRSLAEYPAVEEFIALDGVGHCPQDEAPDRVNPLLLQWLDRQLERH